MRTGVVCLVLALAGGGTAISEARARELTFEDRVRAQEAIERVYWSHRIWPRENSAPKPALSAVLSETTIRAKVEDYLRKSSALAELCKRPINAAQLQAEMD